ncbi:DUF2290 domain-containing protein [Flavobacterium sp.]|uniref:DUF2290 domain-containing protein n=1 Tax=Flavobacterium sp. TaxID=239 RepID=UPI002BDA5C6A|nr:DUF2290 domain-containing protein [Flavobacterium sp.]HSD06388.1 DUF2290 domain-containing protein [Flavobacterium sp.]
MTIEQVIRQINDVTSKLIGASLSEEQNFPSEKDGSVYISGNHDLSIALKNLSYNEIYTTLEQEKNFNIKMMDGALIQLMYNFDKSNGMLKKCRLAFFPSPNLEEFQNNSEIYELDEIYADVISKNIVSTPIRFDYDPVNHIPVEHPNSHMTIGQYKNCRIPLSVPLTPNMFIDFILRSFYNTAKKKFTEQLVFDKTDSFDECIHDAERKILHFNMSK